MSAVIALTALGAVGCYIIGWVLGYKTGRAGRVEVVPKDFVHLRHVQDPEHYDEQGRYMWWGS